MQKPLAIFAAISINFLTASLAAAQSDSSEIAKQMLDKTQQKVGAATFTAPDYHPGTIQHIVLFKYKKSISTAQIKDVRQRFLALKTEAKRHGKPYINQLKQVCRGRIAASGKVSSSPLVRKALEITM